MSNRSLTFFVKLYALQNPKLNQKRSSLLAREISKILHQPIQRSFYRIMCVFDVSRATRSDTAAAEPAKDVPVDLSGSISFQNRTNESIDMTKDILSVENDHVQFYSKDIENCTVNMYVDLRE